MTTTARGRPSLANPSRDAELLQQMGYLLPWPAMADAARQSMARAPVPNPTGVQHDAAVLLRLYFLQCWFGFSDEAMADKLLCIPLYRSFAQLDAVLQPLPDAAAIRHFGQRVSHSALGASLLCQLQRLVPTHLYNAAGTVGDAALVAWAVSQMPAAEAQPITPLDTPLHTPPRGSSTQAGNGQKYCI